MKVKHVSNGDGSRYGVRFDCPGCGTPHVVATPPSPNAWAFNGDVDRPTLSPSILVYPRGKLVDNDNIEAGVVQTPRCHSFVRDGRIEFLSDCEHALKGQTADLPDIEDA